MLDTTMTSADTQRGQGWIVGWFDDVLAAVLTILPARTRREKRQHAIFYEFMYESVSKRVRKVF